MITFGEFKKLDYPDIWPIEQVLSKAFYDGQIDFLAAMAAYTSALERERGKANGLFNEAASVIAMGLSGNWKKPSDKSRLCKRAVHILNLNNTFPKNVYNEKYGYTDDDKKEWDEFTQMHYDI